MSLENRPFIGTALVNKTRLVQHTPDAVVYVNGDVTLPGCSDCSGRIEIQKFLTEVSVDAGTTPDSATCSFTLSIPSVSEESFARDAKQIIEPGLEVQVFMRGYFPVQGAYSNLAEPSGRISDPELSTDSNYTPPVIQEGESDLYTFRDADGASTFGALWIDPMLSSREASPPLGVDPLAGQTGPPSADVPPSIDALISGLRKTDAARSQVAKQIYAEMVQRGFTPAFALAAVHQSWYESNWNNNAINQAKDSDGNKIGTPELNPAAIGVFQINVFGGLGNSVPYFQDGKKAGTATQARLEPDKYWNAQDISLSVDRFVTAVNRMSRVREVAFDPTATIQKAFDVLFNSPLGAGRSVKGEVPDRFDTKQIKSKPSDLNATSGPSLLQDLGLESSGIEDLLSYPYYPVFRGVIISASNSWSNGTGTLSVACSGLLSFWNNHLMSTNASYFGSRPVNSKLQTSLVGHNFTGKHPYQILYTLHYDVGGSAGGVAWALASQTNQEASSSLTGESLFSMYLRYWEQRFASRQVRLRLHGASGEAFTAAQSAFLSRLSTNELMKLIRNRFVDPVSATDPSVKGLLEASRAVGLSRSKIDALVQAQGLGANNPAFEINLAEMQAFVLDANFGEVNAFESTYESKMDVAQQVCEVTGFEFYQDMDGDFVFKPPMYNLDTSSSRVYVIEDIDLISVTTEEGEPAATYIRATNPGIENMSGTGLENEYGVNGTYIDYRLVAKFGWRQADYQTHHINDPKALFYNAINRLDYLNIGVNSCNVQIPVRPEIKPGYPVYIRALDAFYYVSGVSHSVQFGNQCITNLSLTAKRSKFWGPGDPKGKGVGAIKLDQTFLPAKPLEVLDGSGKPKLAGFPNVVMALDPYELNPLFFVTGFDSQDFTSDEDIRSLLQMGVRLGVLSQTQDDIYTMQVPTQEGNTTVRFYYGSNSEAPPGTISVRSAADRYLTYRDSTSARITVLQTEKDRLTQELSYRNSAQSTALAFSRGLGSDTLTELDSEIRNLEAEIRSIEAQQRALKDGFDSAVNSSTRSELGWLLTLVSMMKSKYIRENPDYPRLNSTVSLLTLLSEKKASLGTMSQPGYYRYYSASHPDPAHQGPPAITYDNTGASQRVAYSPAPLSPEYRGVQIQGFLPTVTLPYPGAYIPEAQIGPMTPTNGVPVLKNGKTLVVPTSHLYEVAFSPATVRAAKPTTSTEVAYTIDGLPPSVYTTIAGVFAAVGPVSDLVTPRQHFTGVIKTLLGSIDRSFVAANAKGDLPAIPTLAPWRYSFDVSELSSDLRYAGPSVPGVRNYVAENSAITEVKVYADLLALDTPYQDYAFSNKSVSQSASDAIQLRSPQLRKLTFEGLASKVGETLAKRFVDDLRDGLALWVRDISASKSVEEASQALTSFVQALGGEWGIEIPVKSKIQSVDDSTVLTTTVTSPVFPVSDAQGYEVIGSYRYGRGVSIDADGVWANLHAQDPLSLLDKRTVEEIVDFFTTGSPVYADVPVYETDSKGNPRLDAQGRPKPKLQGGSPVTTRKAFAGDKGLAYLEKKVLDELRAQNLTDTQILHLFKARPGTNPNSLQLGLQNMFRTGNSGVEKLPINNRAFSYNDIRLSVDQRVCTCKAKEAAHQLDLFGSQEFIRFDGKTDLTKGLAQQGVAVAEQWARTQAAYAGKADPVVSDLADQVSDFFSR